MSVYKGHSFIRHREAPGTAPGAAQLLPLLGRKGATAPAVKDLPIPPVGRRGGQTLGPGAEAGIDQSHLLQLPEPGGIELRPLTLPVGTMGSPHLISLVPVQTQPAQILRQDLGILLPAAVGVQILHPQDQRAARRTHRQPGQQRCKHISKVHPSAGTGRKASPQQRFHVPSSFPVCLVLFSSIPFPPAHVHAVDHFFSCK